MNLRKHSLHRVATFSASLALVLGAACAGQAADAADPTVAELLRRIEALEQALDEVKRGGASCASATPAAAGAAVDPAVAPALTPAGAPASQGAVVAVRKTSEPVEAAIPPAFVTGYGKNGFGIASADGDYGLRIGGQIEADGRFFVDDGPSSDVDQFNIRRARFNFRGVLAKRFAFRMTPEFAGNNVNVLDADIATTFAPWAVVTVGRLKAPFGLERLQTAPNLVFMERALPNNLVPNRDIGLQASGKIGEGRLEYQFMVANGAPDGGSSVVDVNDGVDLAARVFATPWVNTMYGPLRGLGAGLSATWGHEQGKPSSTQLSAYKTSAGSTFFSYANDNPATVAGTTVADGQRYRLSPQAYWYEGSFGFLTEYVMSSQQLEIGATRGWITNDAWQTQFSYILTGEKAAFDGFTPASPFNFGGGGPDGRGWGAWEVAARWSALDVDPDAFSRGFADPTKSARHTDALGLAINWHLNRHITTMFDYEHVIFGGGNTVGNRTPEDAFMVRARLVF